MDESHYEELLSRQLVMNQQTWATLQKHGVNELSELRLDFSYNAPNPEAAEVLRSFLCEETDYDVRVESNGTLWRKSWAVASAPAAEIRSRKSRSASAFV